MLVALIPLFMLAASLHESLFDSLGYHSAAGVSGMISNFFAGGTVSQFYHGTVTFVELRINHYDIDLFSLVTPYRPSVHLDGRYLSLVNQPTTASYSGLGEQSSASGQHMTVSYKLEPTRPSAAAAPVQAWAAGPRIQGCPTATPLVTPAFFPAPSGSTPESGAVATPLLTTGVDSAISVPSPAASLATPTVTNLDVLVPTLFSVTTPESAQHALSSPLAIQSNGELGLGDETSAIMLVQVVRMDPPVGELASNSPFLAPAYDFKPEEYTVATPHVVVATSIFISTPVPSTPSHQPTVIPVITDQGPVSGSSTWVSRHGWVLVWTVLLVLQAGIAIGLYLNQRRPVQCCRQDAEISDVLKILRLLRELGDLPNIIDEYDISPSELRSYIDLVVETRRSVYGNSTVESSAEQPVPASPHNSYSRQESSSVGLTLAPSSSTSRQGRSASAIIRTSDTTDDVSARVAALHKGQREQEARLDQALGELSEAIASAPRREEENEVRAVRGEVVHAFDSVERRKTNARALVNISPLAHRVLKRVNGRMMAGALPTPEPSRGRTWTETVKPRAGDHRTEATNDLENTRSVSFDPVATSSPARATRGDRRNVVSKGHESIRSMSFNPVGTSSPVGARGLRIPVYNQSTSYQVRQGRSPRKGISPDSTVALSRPGDGSSLVREPLPPVTSAYVSFGTLAEVHLPPRPQAPEPDITLDSPFEESEEERSG